jgi:ParB family chromosome partitioning protein
MDSKNKSVHSSGPLGMLMSTGQIHKIDNTEVAFKNSEKEVSPSKNNSSYFKTNTGIEFSEQELVYVDPKECEHWKYANRQSREMDLDELRQSIKVNKQLQPALIRNHPKPHDGINYEVIFGCRRHLVCLSLGIPFLAIRKEISATEDAIAFQDAENKQRNNVSGYSNATLYKRLIEDGVFKTEKDIAEKLYISSSTFNDLMSYAKIPDEIVNLIPNIHSLSKQLAIAIVKILNKSDSNYTLIKNIAPEIGKSITSEAKLQHAISNKMPAKKITSGELSKVYSSSKGSKMFTLKRDIRGLPVIVLSKEIANLIDLENMCTNLSDYLNKTLYQSGYPD